MVFVLCFVVQPGHGISLCPPFRSDRGGSSLVVSDGGDQFRRVELAEVVDQSLQRDPDPAAVFENHMAVSQNVVEMPEKFIHVNYYNIYILIKIK